MTSDLRTAAAPASLPVSTTAGPQRPSGFRPDVEGLRAVAVGLVVLFHAGVGAVSGGFVGVDVFFVLSGFLITGLLAGELRRTGTISIRGFYARRVRRLLPLAALVIVATAGAGLLVVPGIDHPGTGLDLLASALYAANWRFALSSTDYMAADVDKSPALHFWSLAVEEQFYVVWPLLLLLASGALWRHRGALLLTPRALTRRMGTALAAVGAASLVASWQLSETSGSWAYYGLHTRAWELAVGAGLALAVPALGRLPRRGAGLLGWVGLAAVVASALTFSTTTVFPGTAALLPVLGTAALVAAGVGGQNGAAALLGRPLPRYVGRISYAWYLWHWPCIVLTRLVAEDRGWAQAPAVAGAVVVSFGLAAASHVLVEQPARTAAWLTRSPAPALAAGAALTAAGVAASLLLSPFASTTVPGSLADGVAPVQVDAQEPVRGTTGPVAPLMTPEQARVDQGRPKRCFVSYDPSEAQEGCLFGDPSGTRTVALVGDSHAMHWYRAADALARERGWRLHVWAKTACSVVDVRVYVAKAKAAYTACDTWRDDVVRRLDELPRLDLLLVARSQGYARATLGPDGELLTPETVGPTWSAGAERTFSRLAALADQVVLLRDTPWSPEDVPGCLSRHDRADWAACEFPRAEGVHLDEPLLAAERPAAARYGIRLLDMTGSVCPGDPCPVVASNGAIIYGDDSHFTNTFSASLRDVLGRRLDDVVGAG